MTGEYLVVHTVRPYFRTDFYMVQGLAAPFPHFCPLPRCVPRARVARGRVLGAHRRLLRSRAGTGANQGGTWVRGIRVLAVPVKGRCQQRRSEARKPGFTDESMQMSNSHIGRQLPPDRVYGGRGELAHLPGAARKVRGMR